MLVDALRQKVSLSGVGSSQQLCRIDIPDRGTSSAIYKMSTTYRFPANLGVKIPFCACSGRFASCKPLILLRVEIQIGIRSSHFDQNA